MRRAFQLGTLLLAAVATVGAQQGGKEPKGPPPAKAMPKGGMPKSFPKGLPKAGGGPRLNNPANQFERLIAMPPEERDRVLEKLPPQQQERLRERLDRWDKLPPQQKALQLEMLKRYASLPPEKQPIYLQQIQAFNQLPRDRRQQVVQELRVLWRLPEDQRQARLNSEDYKTRFSPAELQMLNEISITNPLPGR